jgi:glucosylceramidase
MTQARHVQRVAVVKYLATIAAILACKIALAAPPTLHWKCSTAAAPWTDQPDISATAQSTNPVTDVVWIDTNHHFQTIDGWGGCFNERGWLAMQILTEPQRTQIMRSMFDPSTGLELNICRTPIAASDYAIALYSYDETPRDFTMAHFSIDRDRQFLIPFIKAALAIQPDLKLWAVPWSPPSWMKTSGKLTGGHIFAARDTMNALALYFVKYVEAYHAQGIPVYMVMPQNEPCYSTNYTSCEWTGSEMGVFVRDYLGPLFANLHVDCQIYLGTFPRSEVNQFDYIYWLADALNDPATRAYVTGVGCQWYGDAVMREAHEKNPNLKLMQTEAECGATNSNDWPFASKRFEQVVNYLACGAESFMAWNLVLDETGRNTAGWAQCSPIVVNQQTKEVTYTPYFYALEHFSHFVHPGAIRIPVTIEHSPAAAFINPGGQTILVIENPSDAPEPISPIFGDRKFSTTLPPQSFNTFVLDK